MTDESLRQAIALYKAGNRPGARQILAEIVRNDPRNETAWLWLAGSVDTADQKRLCLERALEINPNNQNARLALQQLEPDIPQPSLSDLSISPSAARPNSQPSATAIPAAGATHPPATDPSTPVSASSDPAEQKKRNKSAQEKPVSTSMLVIIGALVILCLGSFSCAAYFYVQRLINNSQAVAILVTSASPNAGPAQNATGAPMSTTAPTLAAIPALTATAAPTATPDLFRGSAQSLVPNQADMPIGFVLNPSGSGPIQVDSGDGFGSNYMNHNNIFSFQGDAINVLFAVYVPLSQAGAKLLYQNIASGAADKMTATAPGTVVKQFAPVNVTLAHVDEASALCGTIQGPAFPTTLCSVVFRMKNVVVWTLDAANDTGGAQASIFHQTVYFTSLVVDKIG